jgi:mono/diheme cytochrome c family protein
VVLVVAASLASAVSFAQSSGEAIYKAKCTNCHGPAGLANSGISMLMKVKPVSDPSVRNMPEEEMVEATRKGMGKMQGYKSELNDAQIKSVVAYFRTFVK